MTRSHLVLIKVGGGLITKKAEFMTANDEAIDRVVNQLSRAKKECPDADLILGNGVGSYAHFTAHKYALRDGAHNIDAVYGVAQTHLGAAKLNMLLTEALQKKAELPALALSPMSMMVHNDHGVKFNSTPLKYALHKEYLPVLHGDTVLSTTRGVKIFSTEMILFECLKAFAQDYKKVTTIYLTDADGVLDDKKETIQNLTKEYSVKVHDAHRHDVTGGVTEKVAAARATAEVADEVYIVSGWIDDAIARVIKGEHLGTRVYA